MIGGKAYKRIAYWVVGRQCVMYHVVGWHTGTRVHHCCLEAARNAAPRPSRIMLVRTSSHMLAVPNLPEKTPNAPKWLLRGLHAHALVT